MKSFLYKSVFVVLLPIFFFLHAFRQNFAPGLLPVVLGEIIIFSTISLVLNSLLFLYFRNWQKASLFSLFLMSFNFFFGAVHDLLKGMLNIQSLVLRYIFIVPFLLVCIVCLGIYLKRTRKDFRQLVLFLNILFALFIVLEITGLLIQAKFKKKNEQANLPAFKGCTGCQSPDVYLIIADEYAGDKALTEVFSFTNREFEKDLQDRGFHVLKDYNSNYNATVYSMASLLNMDYVTLSGNGLVTQRDMLLCRSIINHSNTGRFFKDRGYEFHNFSFFEWEGKPKAVNNYYFPPKRNILVSQTFISRLRKQLSYHFFSKKKREAIEKNDYNNDETIDRLTRELAAKKTGKPKFVYTHLTRPHHPYYVDRNGLAFNHGDSLRGFDRIKKEYTEHLLYTNKRLVQLIDHIKANSPTPPLILLASDHGFRQFIGQGDIPYYFMSFCALYLPNGQYAGFYDGLSPVNTFRVILNKAFGQQLPMLKDSSIFLTEKQ